MPIQITSKITNLDNVQIGLRKFGAALPGVLRKHLKRALDAALFRSIPYRGGNQYDVPERNYERTGNLGRSAWVEQRGASYAILVQAVSKYGYDYSVDVVGNAAGQGQARIHYGYWTPMRNAVELELGPLTTGVENDLRQGAEAVGL